MNCGIVIGSYGMPGVVELGIALARHTCGDVPILVSDDATPECRGRDRIRDLPKRWDGVELVVSDENLGHAPGDVRAFRNGLRWAKRLNLDFLAKFSQRFIPVLPDWLNISCRELDRVGVATASQRGIHLNLLFPLRTEAVLFDVRKTSDAFVKAMDPPGGKIPCAAENFVYNHLQNAGMLPFHRWGLFGPDRFAKMTTHLWHNTHGDHHAPASDQAYLDWAEKLGVDLGPEFSAHGWHIIAHLNPHLGYKMM